jgi:N-acetylneuraminic acid mutarotase
MNFIIVFCISLIISVIGFQIYFVNSQASSTTTTSQTSWSIGAGMPTARTEVAGAVLDGKIYVIGGFEEQGKATDVVEVYDPLTDTWDRVSPLPIPLEHTAVSTYNGKLFVVGGYTIVDEERTPTDKLFSYDPSTDKWEELESMPIARGALTANFIDGILYAIGGEDSSLKTLTKTEAYDPTTDTWSTKSSMPTPRHHIASIADDGKIYVIGGRQTGNLPGQNVDATEVYDTKSDTWNVLQQMPTKRSGLATAIYNDSVYVFGGEDPFNEPTKTFENTEIYHPINDTWTSGSSLPTARHGHVALTVDDKIYVIGGGPEPGLSYSHINEVLNIK